MKQTMEAEALNAITISGHAPASRRALGAPEEDQDLSVPGRLSRTFSTLLEQERRDCILSHKDPDLQCV